jgi:REP element-mobilizing transposase RayT
VYQNCSFGEKVMPFYDRKNHRLKNYDYGRYGYYYVTICTNNRAPLLSTVTTRVQDDTSVSAYPAVGSDALVAPKPSVTLTPLGEKVLESWYKIETLNENVFIQKFVFMPDHIHGIILIKNPDVIADPKGDFDFQVQERRGRRSLQGLIKDFKSVTTRQYKAMFQVNESLWRESYYDEVIRSQEKYHEIWNYIEHNPARWIMKENH